MEHRWAHFICATLGAAGFLFFATCGSPHNSGGENYGNLLDNPLGLELTQPTHPIGWGKASCYECHNIDNIHQVNRTGIPIDMADVRELATEGGEAGCADCHGTNGVD